MNVICCHSKGSPGTAGPIGIEPYIINLSKLVDHDIYDIIAKYNVLTNKPGGYIYYYEQPYSKYNVDLNCRFIFIMTVGIKI